MGPDVTAAMTASAAPRLLFVAANPSIDRLYEVDRLAIGGIHRPLAEVAVPGGKGLNAARAAATLGGSVTVVGIVAGRAGEWIVDGLATLGIEARMARGPGETRTCVSILDRADGRLTEVYPRGPQVEFGDLGRLRIDGADGACTWRRRHGAVGQPSAGCAVRRVRAHRSNGGGPGAPGPGPRRHSRRCARRAPRGASGAGQAQRRRGGRCHEHRRDGRVVRGRRSNRSAPRRGGRRDRDPGSEWRGGRDRDGASPSCVTRRDGKLSDRERRRIPRRPRRCLVQT